MLRSEEERDFGRKFTVIETWEEFLKRWKAIDTEQEVIGLLYAGPKIPPFDNKIALKPELKGEEAEKRVKFYLNVIRYSENPNIKTIAEQVIIKQWLKIFEAPWQYVYPGYLNTCVMIMEFLQNPNESLISEPYPRFVSKFLLSLYTAWSSGCIPDYRNGKEYLALQPHTELIVRNLCTWGLAYHLADESIMRVGSIIKEFLDENRFKIDRVFEELSGHGSPPTNLKRGEAAYIAACAYVKMRHRFDGRDISKIWR